MLLDELFELTHDLASALYILCKTMDFYASLNIRRPFSLIWVTAALFRVAYAYPDMHKVAQQSLTLFVATMYSLWLQGGQQLQRCSLCDGGLQRFGTAQATA